MSSNIFMTAQINDACTDIEKEDPMTQLHLQMLRSTKATIKTNAREVNMSPSDFVSYLSDLYSKDVDGMKIQILEKQIAALRAKQ